MLRSTWRTWTAWTHGRRGAAIGASAAVVCLGGMLAACGAQGGGDGYVATGSAPQASGEAVRPTGDVSLVPLDPETQAPLSEGPADSPGAGGSSSGPSVREGPSGADSPDPAPSTGTEAATGAETGAETEAGTGVETAAGTGVETAAGTGAEGAESPRTPATSPPPSSGGSSPTASPAPAALTWSEPEREPTDERWCEKVTVDFHNSGGTAVRSGTVTFETHIIGLLGIDWGTVESTEELPVPVRAGARKEQSWTVCVDEWRVPLGMHIETRDVSVQWK
ncbi:hypothetical protein [Streptomyces blattellae]|uniref:hypothetical protein n=1 Tax=Streptomyces blattellae TaxID=2569855 RepID=UPI0012B81806|nr:hypothetical protein [Streptomyces blattellae]